MKILVVSHNVFSKTSNMGKTLGSYFSEVKSEDLAQFYIHSEIPTDPICKNYYRITDKEAIKSIFTRKSGRILGESDINEQLVSSRTDSGTTAKLYQRARKRTPLTYIARNTWWALGAWNTKKLRAWLDDFNPDVVFFPAGDYSFMYKIALRIAKYRGIPLAVCCMDDFFFYNKNQGSLLGRWVHKRFMKQVGCTMDYSSCIFTICDKMNKDYGALFSKRCYTLHTPSTLDEPLNEEKVNKISYIGNLGYNRHLQLKSIGKALKALKIPGAPEFVDVYSSESRPEILTHLTEENGIRFHGEISYDQVKKVIGESLAVIHTESFDEDIATSVRYSVSTKIADSLASGTCLIAYGPSDVASISYLIDNDAAFCITDESELGPKLTELLTDPDRCAKIRENALKLARKNHDSDLVCKAIINVLKVNCAV